MTRHIEPPAARAVPSGPPGPTDILRALDPSQCSRRQARQAVSRHHHARRLQESREGRHARGHMPQGALLHSTCTTTGLRSAAPPYAAASGRTRSVQLIGAISALCPQDDDADDAHGGHDAERGGPEDRPGGASGDRSDSQPGPRVHARLGEPEPLHCPLPNRCVRSMHSFGGSRGDFCNAHSESPRDRISSHFGVCVCVTRSACAKEEAHLRRGPPYLPFSRGVVSDRAARQPNIDRFRVLLFIFQRRSLIQKL